MQNKKNPSSIQMIRVCNKKSSKNQNKTISFGLFQNHINENKHDSYHLLEGNDECNIFFDLDKKFNEKTDNEYALLDEYINSVKSIILQDHEEEPEFAITCASRIVADKYKMSFHLVVTNYFCKVKDKQL